MLGSRSNYVARFSVYVGASCVALASLCRVAGLVFNLTPSIPRGIYEATSVPREKQAGYYILFCPDQKWPGFANNPNYRKSYVGNCPDGEEALIKPVSAWPGDTVTTTPNGVAVNGAIILNSTPNTKDPFGKDLHPYAYGSYQVPAGQLWVVSNYSSRSFDSRYFGPIPVASIRTWLKPVIVEKAAP